MGLFDIFKRRSQKESAVTKEELEALGGGSDSGSGGGGSFEAGGSEVNLTDGVSLSEMGHLLKQAIKTGNVQVTPGDSKVVDLRGTGAREEIFAAMKKHGINPEDHGKTVDAAGVAGLQEDIMKVLKEHGVQVPGGVPVNIIPRDGGAGSKPS